MKYIALSALFSLTSAVELKNTLTNQEKLYKILEKDQGWGGWGPNMHEFPGTVNDFGNWVDPYERVLPLRFQGDAADDDGTPPVDKFTQKLIENYAFEKATGPAKDGKTAWDAHHPLPSG